MAKENWGCDDCGRNASLTRLAVHTPRDSPHAIDSPPPVRSTLVPRSARLRYTNGELRALEAQVRACAGSPFPLCNKTVINRH